MFIVFIDGILTDANIAKEKKKLGGNENLVIFSERVVIGKDKDDDDDDGEEDVVDNLIKLVVFVNDEEAS